MLIESGHCGQQPGSWGVFEPLSVLVQRLRAERLQGGPQLAVKRLRLKAQAVFGLIGLRGQFLLALSEALLRLLRKDALEFSDERPRVALQLRTDLHRMRLGARRILFEPGIRLGIE